MVNLWLLQWFNYNNYVQGICLRLISDFLFFSFLQVLNQMFDISWMKYTVFLKIILFHISFHLLNSRVMVSFCDEAY